mmetsp:Transcript_5319/g.7064  ORF Transcript_5319/g.7064 Transcript_5319/m.7064 type:complete len:299 (+) Transcript_5319:996-1892(+)
MQRMQRVKASTAQGTHFAKKETKVDAKIGCYWRYQDYPTVYWASTADGEGRMDIQFFSPEEYFPHREANGWPKDWSNIAVLPPPKGCYFKIGKAPFVYWSITGKPDQTDIKFENPEAYYIHRKKHGSPPDWSGIITIPTVGCYWKHFEAPTVYYSQTKPGVRHVAFADPKAYFTHRYEHGFEKDWKGIGKVQKGYYWKAAKLPQVHWCAKRSFPPAEVTFGNPSEYNQHRLEHGMPQDWTEIHVVIGLYWKRKTDPSVFWAQDGKAGTETVKFPDGEAYMAHRKQLGFPPDFSLITTI